MPASTIYSELIDSHPPTQATELVTQAAPMEERVSLTVLRDRAKQKRHHAARKAQGYRHVRALISPDLVAALDAMPHATTRSATLIALIEEKALELNLIKKERL